MIGHKTLYFSTKFARAQWQRAENYRVDDAEHHRVRADAEAEDGGGGESKDRRPPQRSERESEVAEQTAGHRDHLTCS